MQDQLKACNEGLHALNLELEAHLTDDQVAEDYACITIWSNAAATLALLSHYIEELKASTSRIPDSAATNIANEGILTAGSRVWQSDDAGVRRLSST